MRPLPAYTIASMTRKRGIPESMRYEALLLITAAIWGTGFVAQRLGMQNLGPFSYNAARFAVGALVLVPVLLVRRTGAGALKASLAPGLAAGAVLAVAAALQQSGLQYTSAGKAGFITGLYVVLVPIAAMFLGKKTPPLTWLGAGCALGGLYLLSFAGDAGINRGDVLVFASAFFWTAHILVLDRWASRVDPIALACVQFAVCSAICWASAALTETLIASDFVAAALPVAYGGLFSIGIAYTLQAIAQSKAHPSRASIIMSLESPFAVLSGFLVLGERLGAREALGCALMLGGMIVAQLRFQAPRTP